MENKEKITKEIPRIPDIDKQVGFYVEFDELINDKIKKRIEELKHNNKLESDKTNEISAALSQAQGEFEEFSASKTSFKGRYADFFSIVKSVRKSLSKHKLCITQQIKWINETMIFSTKLRHASGQWIESQIPILQKFIPSEASKSPIQAFGSTITYLERYAFKALLNIAYEKDPTDDDGYSKRNVNQSFNTGGYVKK